MKTLQYICILTIMLACSSVSNNEVQVKKLYAGSFEMEIPRNWKFKKELGIDSYVGFIKTPSSPLYFDHSSMGYANNLIPSIKEYLERELRVISRYTPPGNIGVSLKTNNEKYYAVITYEDTIIKHEIFIDKEVSSHYFEIDTISNYYRKLIYPKKPGKGMTGIYMKDINSLTNFQMNGNDLTLQDQKRAIKAFKSIILN